jgi:predicted O-methyltransferase YrrM
MPLNPHQVYEAYLKDPNQDMIEYQPVLRDAARGNILEIGVRGGVSTASFLIGLEERGGHLWSVDVTEHCGDLYAGHPQWTFIHADSRNVEFVKSKIPVELDILMIDGLHAYEGVWSDFFNYGQMVKSGGIILAHDVAPRVRLPHESPIDWPTLDGPRRAFDEFVTSFKTGSGLEINIGGEIESHEILPGQFGLGVIRIR